MAEWKMYVIQAGDNGQFYCGCKCWNRQLRKAKIYHSLEFANDVIKAYEDRSCRIREVNIEIIKDDEDVCLDTEENPVKRGYWTVCTSGKGKSIKAWVECSVCHARGSRKWKRCRVCEARMDGGSDGK